MQVYIYLAVSSTIAGIYRPIDAGVEDHQTFPCEKCRILTNKELIRLFAGRLQQKRTIKMRQMPFSVLLPVCNQERPEWLDACLHSLLCQTVPASEILLMEDGALSEPLQAVIRRHKESAGSILRTQQVPGNQGLGEVLRQGVLACRFPLIARMDADDVCMPFRFERQLEFLLKHPAVSVVGANVVELRQKRPVCHCVPERNADIRTFARWRNPFCHMTVLFRKEAVLRAGNYRAVPCFEDYDLWIRLLGSGAEGYNIQENLVCARMQGQKCERRGGFSYFRAENAFLKQLRQSGYLQTSEYAVSLLVRGLVRMMPMTLREWFYVHALRGRSGPQAL